MVSQLLANRMKKIIDASKGGTLITSDSIKLVIPANSLSSSCNVFIGITGSEPTSVPNESMEIIGNPITLKITSEKILKPLQVIFPLPSTSLDKDNYFIFLFNGSTYYPMEYRISDGKVVVSIDIIDWESFDHKGIQIAGELIFFVLILKQTPTLSTMGLWKVELDSSGKMKFSNPTANSSSKVFLLVHGWMGRASTWEDFLPRIIVFANTTHYTEYWTFVYNSSWSIKTNAEILAKSIKEYSNGAIIDIVAHSMGGLVARSMIEQYKCEKYVHKLITLGTPHKGSPLAAIRYSIGDLVEISISDPLGYHEVLYDIFTQGFKDLNIDSEFLNEINSNYNSNYNSNVPAIPYFVIAVTNNPVKNILSIKSSDILPGLDDGVVQVSSAKGIPGAFKSNTEINIDAGFAHMKMPFDYDVFEQTLSYLLMDVPTVITSPIKEILSLSAIVGGNITSDGGSSVTERGIFWGRNSNPEITGTKRQVGSGIGSFSVSLTGLNPNTKYYVKAYAINSQGISYGQEVSFTTLTDSQPGTITDIDGNVYQTVQIGTQIWMTSDLKTKRYNNGDQITNVTSASSWTGLTNGAYCYFNNQSGNFNTYGLLYNQYAVLDSRKICPAGWHVPTDDEWKTMEMYLGMSQAQANLSYSERGTNQGGKLKETGTAHWLSPNTGATNETGFTAVPGGWRGPTDGTFPQPTAATQGSFWWTSTSGIYRAVHCYNATIWRNSNYSRNAGFSVRCIRD